MFSILFLELLLEKHSKDRTEVKLANYKQGIHAFCLLCQGRREMGSWGAPASLHHLLEQNFYFHVKWEKIKFFGLFIEQGMSDKK